MSGADICDVDPTSGPTLGYTVNVGRRHFIGDVDPTSGPHWQGDDRVMSMSDADIGDIGSDIGNADIC